MGISTVRQLLRIPAVLQTKRRRSKCLDSFPSTVTKQDRFQSILETILFDEDVCRHDAVILVDHPGVRASPNSHVPRLNFEQLRASHLRRLERTSPLVREIAAAASSLQFPYARFGTSDPPFNDLADVVSRHCNARIVEMQPKDEILDSPGDKYVISVELNSVDSPTIFADCEPILVVP